MQFVGASLTLVSTIRTLLSWNKLCDKNKNKNKNTREFSKEKTALNIGMPKQDSNKLVMSTAMHIYSPTSL